MNVAEIAMEVQRIERAALSLPDMSEVLAGIEVYLLECELHGRPVPAVAWENRLPIFEAVAALQEVCRRQRDLAAQLCARPAEVTFTL